jgi:hypothetical protein
MQMLNDSAALFEVTVPDFKQVKQCRKEIKLLKQLWDYIYLVRTTFDDWKKTKWREINAESVIRNLIESDFIFLYFRWIKNVKNSPKIFAVKFFNKNCSYEFPLIFSFG